MMRLQIALPHRMLVDERAQKVISEMPGGSFCLLPHHIDFTAQLVPGVLMWVNGEGDEMYAAVDQGTLVKVGLNVRVSTQRAVVSDDLEMLHDVVMRTYRPDDELERQIRTASAQLEADFVRRFLELKERGAP